MVEQEEKKKQNNKHMYVQQEEEEVKDGNIPGAERWEVESRNVFRRWYEGLNNFYCLVLPEVLH